METLASILAALLIPLSRHATHDKVNNTRVIPLVKILYENNLLVTSDLLPPQGGKLTLVNPTITSFLTFMMCIMRPHTTTGRIRGFDTPL